MSERALSAKNDDDVGLLRAMREGQDQKLWGSDNRTSEYSCRPRTPFSSDPGSSTDVLAIVAPGQGAQTPGFLSSWLEVPTFADRLSWLSAVSGLDLSHYGTDADAETIRDTAIAQPLLVAAGLLAALELFPHPADGYQLVISPTRMSCERRQPTDNHPLDAETVPTQQADQRLPEEAEQSQYLGCFGIGIGAVDDSNQGRRLRKAS